MRTERIADTDLRFRRNGAGDAALVFVHGFLDDQHAWDGVIAGLGQQDVETVQLDLAGMGERTDEDGPFTYDRFASEAGAVADALDKPVVFVAQSMAGPVVELAAATRPERTLGLVLVDPVPLAGTRLPEEVIESFRSLGGDPQAQRSLREQLGPGLGRADLDRLVVIGGRIRPDVVRALADCWNNGHPDGEKPSRYPGPVLVIRGAEDPVVTDDLLSAGVLPRFGQVESATVQGAGHWAHIEQPTAVAGLLDAFMARVHHAGEADVRPQGWTTAFAEKSADSFWQAFTEDVVLEASALTRPVTGREQVSQVMGAASGIYESLAFTQESSQGRRTYMEWEATAFGGTQMQGVTVLTKDEQGRIVRIAIHHRPLGAALRFSAELRRRLAGRIDADHFYDGQEEPA
jgi:pimeloyl-ACP methyl ester carboxylesterase